MDTKIIYVLLLLVQMTIILSLDSKEIKKKRQNVSLETEEFDSKEDYEDDSFELIDFQNLLNSDDDAILIWKIQDGEPVTTESTNYNVFKSSNTYIVLQGKATEDTESWKIYYWIGKNASTKDIADAGSYAVLLDSLCHSTVNIRREVEEQESCSFKSLQNDKGNKCPIISAKYATEKFKNILLKKNKNTNISLLRIFNENGLTKVKPVNERPLQRSLFESDNCYVMDPRSPADGIFVWMGKDSEVEERQEAVMEAELLLEKKYSYKMPINFIEEDTTLTGTSEPV